MIKTEDVHDVIIMIGTCALGTWVSDFIRAAYSVSAPPVEVHLGDRDHVFPDIGRAAGDARVMMMIGPGRRLMDAIAARRTPVVAVLDDPVDSVRYQMRVRSSTFLDALRDQTKNAAANDLFRDNPAALLILRGDAEPARAVLGAVMAHVGLTTSAAAEAALLTRFGGTAEEGWSLEAALAHRVWDYVALDDPSGLDEADATLVRQVLAPLMRGALSPDIGTIMWPGRVFLSGDRHDVAPAKADVTGAARVIFHGPYFHLPPGVWAASIVVGFSSDIRGTPFRMVVYAHERPIAKVMLLPEGGGRFEGAFALVHNEPEHFLEVHFMNDEGSIEGSVSLGHIAFTRSLQPPASPGAEGVALQSDP